MKMKQVEILGCLFVMGLATQSISTVHADTIEECGIEENGCFVLNRGHIFPDGSIENGGLLYIAKNGFFPVGTRVASTPNYVGEYMTSSYNLLVHSRGSDAGGIYVFDDTKEREMMRIGSISQAGVGQSVGTFRFAFDPNVQVKELEPFLSNDWTCVDGPLHKYWESTRVKVRPLRLSRDGVTVVLEAWAYGPPGSGQGTPPKGRECHN